MTHNANDCVTSTVNCASLIRYRRRCLDVCQSSCFCVASECNLCPLVYYNLMYIVYVSIRDKEGNLGSRLNDCVCVIQSKLSSLFTEPPRQNKRQHGNISESYLSCRRQSVSLPPAPSQRSELGQPCCPWAGSRALPNTNKRYREPVFLASLMTTTTTTQHNVQLICLIMSPGYFWQMVLLK